MHLMTTSKHHFKQKYPLRNCYIGIDRKFDAYLEGAEVEGDDVPQHAHAFVERAVLVVLGE